MSAEPAERAKLESRALLACCFIALTVLVPRGAAAGDNYPANIERDVPVKMRDGVILRADVCRPIAEGKFPVLLTRTPYDKNGTVELCLKAAARGYVIVVQDVRGRNASEGDWYPFRYESLDGYDTVEWAAALPYSNGKVGMFGGSYVGATQFLAAIAQPLISPEFVPMLLRPTITMAGPTRAELSRNGSTSRGRRDWL